MAVRSTLGAVVFRLPYSDKLPKGVKSMLGDKNSPPKTPPPELAERSAGQKIHSRILEKRLVESPNLPEGTIPTHLGTPFITQPEEEETLRETDLVASKDRVVQQYLNEQNAKFNKLINRNLQEVLEQQSKFEEEVGWRRLVFELALSRNTEEVTLRVNLLMSKASRTAYSYVPFSKKKKTQPEVNIAEAEARAQSLELLDQLDYDEKVLLLQQLLVDLGVKGDEELAKLSSELGYKSNDSMIDKIELIILLSVRLGFIGLKFFIPITQLIYTKFKNNEMVVFNNNNLSRLLGVAIHMMESLEEKLQVLEPPQEVKREEAPPMTKEELLKVLDQRQQQEQESKNWLASISRISTGFSPSRATDYANDPRYSHYFSDRNLSPPSGRLSRSLESSDKRDPPTVLEVAQRFASQMA